MGVETNPDVLAAANRVAAAGGKQTCLDPKKVLAGVEYTCADGKKRKGSFLEGSLPRCTADGEQGCIAGGAFPAVEKARVKPGVIKAGVKLAGVNGGYPSADFPLEGADPALTDLPELSPSLTAGTYEFFDAAGTRRTGAVVDFGTVVPSTQDQAISAPSGLLRSVVVKGDASLAATNIVSGASVFGVAGNVVLPGVGDVRQALPYGVGGTGLTGTLVVAPVADCTSDGDVDCKIPAVGALRAADTTNFTGWDIRRKRNSTGTVLRFAGLEGLSRTCRNRAKLTRFDNVVAPANTTPGVLDLFDTIDDYTNNELGLPGEIPAWTSLIGGMTVAMGNDYNCGGIFATGGTSALNTGADGALPHDPNGNWQDLTPGVVPGNTPSMNTSDGCNHTDKHCVFKELISGLMVTEVSGSATTWQNGINYCHNLGGAGGAVTSPIPVIGGAAYDDWRLPTQKELTHLYHAGIRGLNQTAVLTSNFGNVNAWTWSSSTASFLTSTAWATDMSFGNTYNRDKTLTSRAVCVR